MTRRSVLALGLLAAAVTGPALGQATGQASFSNLGYTLVDLDPSDSAAPSILFSIPENPPDLYFFPYAAATVRETGPQRWDSHEYTAFDDKPGTSHTASLIRPLGHATAASEPGAGNSPPGPTLSATWSSSGSGEYGGASASATVDGAPIYFTLAPRTRVTFTATHVFQGNIDPASTRQEDVASSAYLSVFTSDERYGDAVGTRNYLSIDTLPESALSIDETQILSVSWDNPGDQPAYLAARMNLWGYSYTNSVLAVPEPAPLAMLLGGLLLLRARHAGLAGARQARRADAANPEGMG